MLDGNDLSFVSLRFERSTWNSLPSTSICSNSTELFHRGLSTRREKRLFTVRSFSYPYSEEHDEAHSFLRARCPAWCDRILLSHSFKPLLDLEVRPSPLLVVVIERLSLQTHRPTYNIIGRDVCVGDHKVCPTLSCGLSTEIFRLARLSVNYGASGSRLVVCFLR